MLLSYLKSSKAFLLEVTTVVYNVLHIIASSHPLGSINFNSLTRFHPHNLLFLISLLLEVLHLGVPLWGSSCLLSIKYHLLSKAVLGHSSCHYLWWRTLITHWNLKQRGMVITLSLALPHYSTSLSSCPCVCPKLSYLSAYVYCLWTWVYSSWKKDCLTLMSFSLACRRVVGVQ